MEEPARPAFPPIGILRDLIRKWRFPPRPGGIRPGEGGPRPDSKDAAERLRIQVGIVRRAFEEAGLPVSGGPVEGIEPPRPTTPTSTTSTGRGGTHSFDGETSESSRSTSARMRIVNDSPDAWKAARPAYPVWSWPLCRHESTNGTTYSPRWPSWRNPRFWSAAPQRRTTWST